jgi:hypothetical protein
MPGKRSDETEVTSWPIQRGKGNNGHFAPFSWQAAAAQ